MLRSPPADGGWFRNGQAADLLLGGPGFNDTGGALRFNRPSGIASDGRRLVLADRGHHRVLVWSALPDRPLRPDLVLGQPDFTACEPGRGLASLNWPGGVAVAGDHLAVADTNNHRVLLWHRFPTRSGQPADLALEGHPSPWSVWSNGRTLVVAVTGAGRVRMWDRWPLRADQPPDLELDAAGQMVSPRGITSDGRFLMVGDAAARSSRGPMGSFVWRSLGAAAPHDFFTVDPRQPGQVWLEGDFAPGGRLVLLGSTLYTWAAPPQGESDPPLAALTPASGHPAPAAGEGSGLVVAGGRVYVSSASAHRIQAFPRVPEGPEEAPAFSVGTDGGWGRLLDPVPAVGGGALFVVAGSRLLVWSPAPEGSGRAPDHTAALPAAPVDAALHGEALLLAGGRKLAVWRRLPRDGSPPERVLTGRIGTLRLENLRGVAWDGRHTFLADAGAHRLAIWDGLPDAGRSPRWTLSLDRPGRLASDGEFLAVAASEGDGVHLLRLSGLPRAAPVRVAGPFRRPVGVAAAGGHLFVADAARHRVFAWRRIEDAYAGRDPDTVLGGGRELEGDAPRAARDGLAWPAALALAESALWVGEHGYSSRLLRFRTEA